MSKIISLVDRINEIKARTEEEFAEGPVDWDVYVECQLDEHADILVQISTDVDNFRDYSKKVETRIYDLEKEVEELRTIINKLIRGLR